MDLQEFKSKVISFFVFIKNFFNKKIKLKKIGLNLEDTQLQSNLLLKYIFKELFYYFFIAFLFLFIIFFVNNILLIGENLLKKRAPFKDVFLVMLYSVPGVVSQSIPFATLIGFLMCLGRMVSDNEILIIRACGYGYKFILLPVLVLGLLIFFVAFFFNDYLQVLSRVKYNQLLSKISQSTPTIVLEPNTIKKLGNSTVVIGDVNENQVSDIVFFTKDAGFDNSIIVAKDSILDKSGVEGILLQLSMADAIMLSTSYDNSNFDVIKADKIIMNIFDTDFFVNSSHGASSFTFFDLNKEIKTIKENNPNDNYKINTWNMELYIKLAIPFSSFLFSFLAFTIAFMFGKNNGLTMGLFVGVLICVLYWAMQITGQLLVVHNQLNSFWCIWFSDIVIALGGLILGIILIKK